MRAGKGPVVEEAVHAGEPVRGCDDAHCGDLDLLAAWGHPFKVQDDLGSWLPIAESEPVGRSSSPCFHARLRS